MSESKDEDAVIKPTNSNRKRKALSYLEDDVESESNGGDRRVFNYKTKEQRVTLVSFEGQQFDIPKKLALMSGYLSEFESCDEYEAVVPLPNIKSDILQRVIEFLQHHVGTPMADIDKPLKSTIMSENVADVWDAAFVDQPQDTIFELILAANFLDIKSLLDLTCAKVASMIRGKTPAEIRSTFNIVDNFTPEEEAQVREENKWVEDS
jgi:S-phase kinase-associated protein 1